MEIYILQYKIAKIFIWSFDAKQGIHSESQTLNNIARETSWKPPAVLYARASFCMYLP